MAAPGKAARTAALAFALGARHRRSRPSGSAPIAETWTSAGTPAAAAASATLPRALDMDLVEIALEDADQVDRRRRRPRTAAATCVPVGDVGADELDLAETAQRLEEKGALRLALRRCGPARRP